MLRQEIHQLPKGRRSCSLESHQFPCDRVREAEQVGVQRNAFEASEKCFQSRPDHRLAARPVYGITNEAKTDGSQVDTDLVRPTGCQYHLQSSAECAGGLNQAVVSQRRLATLNDCHPLASAAVAADRPFDVAFRSWGMPQVIAS